METHFQLYTNTFSADKINILSDLQEEIAYLKNMFLKISCKDLEGVNIFKLLNKLKYPSIK